MGMHPVQVIAVTGGKGGVGKTNVSVNLALALAELGRRVVLLDADLGLANVDVLLGLTTKRTLADVIAGECDLRDVLIQGPGGIRIVPAASGTQSMVQLSSLQHAGLIQAFSEIEDLDVLIIDTAAGIGEAVVSFVRAAHEVLLVVTDEPTSITDAYALIKLLVQDGAKTKVAVVVNAAASKAEGERTYKTLAKACDTFLKMTPPLLGVVRRDAKVREAIRAQTPLLTRHPGSDAARDVEAIAQQLAQAS